MRSKCWWPFNWRTSATVVAGSGVSGNCELCSSAVVCEARRSIEMRTLVLMYCGFSDFCKTTLENFHVAPGVNFANNVCKTGAVCRCGRATPKQYSRGLAEPQ